MTDTPRKASNELPEGWTAELVERAEKVLEWLAGGQLSATKHADEARAILDAVKQGDPVILEARKMREDEVRGYAEPAHLEYLRAGAYDSGSEMQKYVRAIRRGMEMERGND